MRRFALPLVGLSLAFAVMVSVGCSGGGGGKPRLNGAGANDAHIVVDQ